MRKTLIFVPTYNERDNAPRMVEEIHKLGLDADILFVDDNSPDGTGLALEEIRPKFPRLIVQHRSGKLGVGSAHAEAIAWAYECGYQTLVTLDCDFTHSPSDIPAMLEKANSCDVTIGSRWIKINSLPGWNVFRRLMTWLGHLLTSGLLRLPYDASGAFRVYQLDRIDSKIFELIKAYDYAFFFESLFILNRNGYMLGEVPIILPARTYGSSKMSTTSALRSAWYVVKLCLENIRQPEQFLEYNKEITWDNSMNDPQNWDEYWHRENSPGGTVYEIIAGLYRRVIIKSNLEKAIRMEFSQGSKLLHAGCGSGQVDVSLQETMKLTGLDISSNALRLYGKNNPRAEHIRQGSIFDLPFPDDTFDGVYNLGVMEHFTSSEIDRILAEFRRVLKPGGKVLLFWPHRRATSVLFLNICHFFIRFRSASAKALHPPEISLMRSRGEADKLLESAGFRLNNYQFGPADLFVQAVFSGIKRT